MANIKINKEPVAHYIPKIGDVILCADGRDLIPILIISLQEGIEGENKVAGLNLQTNTIEDAQNSVDTLVEVMDEFYDVKNIIKTSDVNIEIKTKVK